mmetsp:Transcript_25832/g.49680  ORF Transcript_25832/g.49680 Transcript_25832/m.49680 type:complete len:268 (+) Transcript_25832:306-1109(+)
MGPSAIFLSRMFHPTMAASRKGTSPPFSGSSFQMWLRWATMSRWLLWMLVPPPVAVPRKKRRRNPLVIPSPLELPKILLRKQIPRLPIEHRIPVLILPVHKRPRKDQPARRLPILRRRPGHVRKPVRLRGIKRNDGGIGLEGMSLVQIHVLVGVPIVLIENESVRFDGHPSPGNVDFQLGIISLVQEEFAIGKSSFPARLAQHVPQGRQELISPKLDFVPIFRPAQLVADDVAVGPPFRFVRLHFLVAVESVFLGVVGVEGPVSLQV